MKVILKQPWIKIQIESKSIYFVGLSETDVKKNINNLSSWISTLTCNFGIIVIENETIAFAAVDHLANFPLYYSKSFITDNWYHVTTISAGLTSNNIVPREIWFLAGQNLSSETSYNEVKRLLPNHYLENNQQIQYRKLNQLEYKADSVKDTIINKFCSNEKTDNVLMVSSGIDSVFLMNLVKKYGTKNWRFIHMYSNSDLHNETAALEYFESFYQIKVEKYNIDNLDMLSSEQLNKINRCDASTNFPDYWFHDELYGKLITLEMAGIKNETIWTGEVTDQLFGNPNIDTVMSTWMQTKSYERIADLWIDVTRSLLKSWICNIDKNWVLKNLFNNIEGNAWKTAYDNVKSDIINYLEMSTIDDQLVRFTNFNYYVKAPLRVWPYSQLPNYQFYHLFSEYDFVPIVFNLTSQELSPNGLFKGYLYNLFKSDLPFYAWQLPKTGPTFKIKRHHNELISKF